MEVQINKPLLLFMDSEPWPVEANPNGSNLGVE